MIAKNKWVKFSFHQICWIPPATLFLLRSQIIFRRLPKALPSSPAFRSTKRSCYNVIIIFSKSKRNRKSFKIDVKFEENTKISSNLCLKSTERRLRCQSRAKTRRPDGHRYVQATTPTEVIRKSSTWRNT